MSKDLGSKMRRLTHTTNLLGNSSYEYVAGRCLQYNELFLQGMPMLALSIEKILKAIICEKDDNFKPKSLNHNIGKLFRVVNQFRDYDVSRFENYMPKLEQLYSMRYHDNPSRGTGLSLGPPDFEMIDDIYIELADQIKLMPDIKFRCGLHALLFDKYDRLPKVKQWALKNNKALAIKIPQWTIDYKNYLTNGGD